MLKILHSPGRMDTDGCYFELHFFPITVASSLQLFREKWYEIDGCHVSMIVPSSSSECLWSTKPVRGTIETSNQNRWIHDFRKCKHLHFSTQQQVFDLSKLAILVRHAQAGKSIVLERSCESSPSWHLLPNLVTSCPGPEEFCGTLLHWAPSCESLMQIPRSSEQTSFCLNKRSSLRTRALWIK